MLASSELRGTLPRTEGQASGGVRATPARTICRFVLSSRGAVAVRFALDVANLARRAAMAQYGRLYDGGASATLAGKDSRGPLQGHGHAHYLVTDEDEDGVLDRLTIWAPNGLDSRDFRALSHLRTLQFPGGGAAIDVEFLGSGMEADLPYYLHGPAKVWRSVTPFILPRHPHWRGQGRAKFLVEGPLEQLKLEFARRGFGGTLVKVVPESEYAGPAEAIPWQDFRRARAGRRPAVSDAFGFRVSFDAPVSGPIALGYGSHYSLGLFTPVVGE